MEYGRKCSQDEIRKHDAQQAGHMRRIKNLETLVKDVDMKHRDTSAQRAEAHHEQVKEIVANNFRLVEKLNKQFERRSHNLTATSEALAQAKAEHNHEKNEMAQLHVAQLQTLQQSHDRQLAQVCAQCEYVLAGKRRELGTFVADFNNYRQIVSQKVKVRRIFSPLGMYLRMMCV